MADNSDDEYDRRRRDKFRRERSDYDRSRERDDRRRDDWNDREWDRGRERRSRAEYRDYDRGRRERFSPPRHDLSPPQKRMRRDWDDHSGDPYHGGYDMPYGGGGPPSYGPPQPWGHPDMHLMQPHHGIPIQARDDHSGDPYHGGYDMPYGGGGPPSYGPPQPWGHPDMHLMQPHHGIPIQARLGNLHDLDMGPPPPVMKTFKEFLLSLDDSVDETEAVKRYNEYKIDFRRQQMQDFFLAHKDEEWFRSRYHPDEAGQRKSEARSALQNRLGVFLYLLENGWFDKISLDMEKAPEILKVLDADYLIEEVSAEEEELLGSSGDQPEDGAKEGNPTEVTIERDDKLVKVLDRLLLYLRIVHSIDYYNSCEYQCEDEMPNRCGLLHVRGPVPPNRITHGEGNTPSLIQDWVQQQRALNPRTGCSSSSRASGPEFVRKHVFNKHGDKIEEVRKEVIFFNNFLMDAKRPSLPEIKPPPPPAPGGPPYPPNQYGGGRGNYDSFRGQGGYPGKPRNRMIRGDPRAIIEYRDLDAPEDVDFF
ncbi:UNVERIFIED_CONTAM: hypothetical protein FKN15_065999 [Acipenser sinensis]